MTNYRPIPQPPFDAALSKVPAVTVGFWVIKVLATTLGETGGDAVRLIPLSQVRLHVVKLLI
jgi:uncharacterized membrane-anchored protein